MSGRASCGNLNNRDLLSSPRVLLLMAVMWLGGSCMLVLGIFVITRLTHEPAWPDNLTVVGINYTTAFILVTLAVITHLSVLFVFIALMFIERRNQGSSESSASASSSHAASVAIVMDVKDLDNPPSYEALMANETPPPPFHFLPSSAEHGKSFAPSLDSLDRAEECQAPLIDPDVGFQGQSEPSMNFKESKLNLIDLCKEQLSEDMIEREEELMGGNNCAVIGNTVAIEEPVSDFQLTDIDLSNSYTCELRKFNHKARPSEDKKSSSKDNLNSSEDENSILHDMLPLIEALYKEGETAANFSQPTMNSHFVDEVRIGILDTEHDLNDELFKSRRNEVQIQKCDQLTDDHGCSTNKNSSYCEVHSHQKTFKKSRKTLESGIAAESFDSRLSRWPVLI